MRKPIDITFCSGSRCEIKRECRRCESNHAWNKNEMLSIAEFSPPEGIKDKGECEYFMEDV